MNKKKKIANKKHRKSQQRLKKLKVISLSKMKKKVVATKSVEDKVENSKVSEKSSEQSAVKKKSADKKKTKTTLKYSSSEVECNSTARYRLIL